jgi:hypothetical protein
MAMRAPPRIPTLQLEQRRDRAAWRWLTGSVLAHALIIIALVVDWTPVRLGEVDVRTPGDAGPLGGGGGGGAERITYVDLPAWESPPPREEEPEPERPEDLVFPTPEVVEVKVVLETPKFDVPRVVVPEQGVNVLGRGPGTGGGPGAGTGTGGGIGSGTGTGVGSHTGPGTGGEGGNIFPPAPRYVALPLDENRPRSVKGKEFRARVVVTAEGRVESVELDPDIRDRDYRRKIIDLVRTWTFAPAYTREGVFVRAETVVTFSL